MTVYEDIVKLVANHLRCSICYDIFVKPVTLLCGHNYCQKCMQDHLQKNPCCPECRTKVGAQLKKNITLCNILEIPEAGGRDLWDQVLTRAEQDVRHEGHTGTRTQDILRRRLELLKQEIKKIEAHLAELNSDHQDGSCFKKDDINIQETSSEVLISSLNTEGASQTTDNSILSQQSVQEDNLNEDPQIVEMEIMMHDSESLPEKRDSISGLSEGCSHSAAGSSGLQKGCNPRASAGSSGFALLTFSPQLGHRRLVFRPDQRRIEVRHSHAARAAQHYFSVCQWMAEQEFASGSHHWDVDTTDCRAWAVGVAHADLRQDQRLGRSPTSWCIEWSSKRLSAWIAGVEMRLEQRRPSRVRVLLDMADGQLAFWSLSDREAELYSVQVEFRAPVRPVFWLFGTQEKNALYFPAP